jgi:Mrp family chromosome partitioning ATPase
MSQLLDANLLMEAMHLGVREFIPLPMSEQKLTAAIERVAAGHGMGKRAKIIHVIPTIGGCGSTTVACNVAASLAKAGTRPACWTWTSCAAASRATSTPARGSRSPT